MKRRLVINVEGDPPPGKTSPVYSLDIVKDILFDDLAANGWRVVSYGVESDSGSFMAFCDDEREELRLQRRQETEKRAAEVGAAFRAGYEKQGKMKP